MITPFNSKYRLITVSGKVAVGTTTLTKNLVHTLGWKHINFGALQRQYDRKHGINENRQGAVARSDDHEKKMEEMGEKMLKIEKNIIYEAWLSGFLARNYKDVLRVLLFCSHEDLKVDRVVNRENISIEEAKHWIKQREEENEKKWKKLYGDYDFWDKKYFNLVIDTYKTGPMETLGKVLDKLGFRHK
ncbi:cytidylate kinase family protein [Candidatus Roizmanbacteria bacterium]|nr:cytidylate kinase family protein [Candidatus Roizmanbacteria bacterium]